MLWAPRRSGQRVRRGTQGTGADAAPGGRCAQAWVFKREVAGLRDENARMKGQPMRPDIKPSGMAYNAKSRADAKTTTKGKKPGRGSMRNRLSVDENRVLRPDGMPDNARFKGYEDYVVEDLEVCSWKCVAARSGIGGRGGNCRTGRRSPPTYQRSQGAQVELSEVPGPPGRPSSAPGRRIAGASRTPEPCADRLDGKLGRIFGDPNATQASSVVPSYTL